MSRDVIQIISAKRTDLEIQLALQCAPVLTGIKISNLFSTEAGNRAQVIELLDFAGISYHMMYEQDHTVIFLLYRQKELNKYLRKRQVKKFLRKMGYSQIDLEQFLDDIAIAYTSYMIMKEGFPHELGVVLGYPVSDVEGFIQHQGRNYQYSGYWKVYKNVDAAKQIFLQFEEAREQLIRMVAAGWGMADILTIYN